MGRRQDYSIGYIRFAGRKRRLPKKIAKNITLLHEYDLKSKGVNRGPGSDWDLLRELVYQLMH